MIQNNVTVDRHQSRSARRIPILCLRQILDNAQCHKVHEEAEEVVLSAHRVAKQHERFIMQRPGLDAQDAGSCDELQWETVERDRSCEVGPQSWLSSDRRSRRRHVFCKESESTNGPKQPPHAANHVLDPRPGGWGVIIKLLTVLVQIRGLVRQRPDGWMRVGRKDVAAVGVVACTRRWR